MEKLINDKKEYKIKKLYLIKLEKFYKQIIKQEKNKNND